MHNGLSAFPLTPLTSTGIDESAYFRLVRRLAKAGVDSIGALGSTGSYMYLSRAERAQACRIAVEAADGIPVMVGISALSTRDAILHAEDAQEAGVDGVLLSPVSYQKLTDVEVHGLFSDLTKSLSVPLVVYDNPGTTNFSFSDELHGRIARLPNVASIKIPGVPAHLNEAKERVAHLRRRIPDHVTIGVSGDASAALGLNAGCEVWYSVIGGLFPEVSLALTRAAQSGNVVDSIEISRRLAPLWELFSKYGGSLRVVATAAEVLGFVSAPSLPSPLMSLKGEARGAVISVIESLELA